MKEKSKPKSKKTIARKPEMKSNENSEVRAKVLEEPKYQETVPEEKPVESSQPPENQISGRIDEEGARYLDEVDLLRWANSILRVKNLRHQASETRTRLENLRLDYEMKRQQHLVQADAFERAAKKRETDDHINLMKEMGARYQVEFLDPNVVIDDQTGKIKLIDPSKG